MNRRSSLFELVRDSAQFIAGAFVASTFLFASELVRITVDWDAVTAVATCAAVLTALYIALAETRRSEASRIAAARVLAVAIGDHLQDALSRCEIALQLWKDFSDKTNFEEVARVAPLMLVKRTREMQRFLDRFEEFGSDDGYVVSAAVSALSNIRRQVLGLKKIAEISDMVKKLPAGSLPHLLPSTKSMFVDAKKRTEDAMLVLRRYGWAPRSANA